MHHPVYKEQSTAAADFPWSGRRECHLSIKRHHPVNGRQNSGAAHRKERMELPQDRARDRWNIERSGFTQKDENGYRQFSVKYKDLSAGPENGIDSVVETTGASSARAGCF